MEMYVHNCHGNNRAVNFFVLYLKVRDEISIVFISYSSTQQQGLTGQS